MDGKCKWKAAILILCTVGLLKEFRPSGPFLVDYAVDHRNFTADQVTFEVLPNTSFAYIVGVLLLLMVTDALCYKPIIVMGGVYTVVTWVITIWAYDSVTWARVRQIFYGFSTVSTEMAYFTYMYANIEKSDYKRVTSYTHSAVHLGQFLSGVTGQILLSFHILHIDEMNYLSLAGGFGSLVVACFLPRIFREFVKTPPTSGKELTTPPPTTEKEKEAKGEEEDVEKANKELPEGLNYHRRRNGEVPEQTRLQRWKEAPKLAKENLIYAYSNPQIIKWSVWWAMAYGLYIQVDLYVESLWKEIEHHSQQKVFNGGVHASHAIISAGLGIFIGATKLCWIKWGCTIFGVGTILQGLSLIVMAYTHDLYVAYGCFIVFQTFFQVLVIISKSQVAEAIQAKSEAFIFGMNTLTACIFHGVLTLVLTGRHGFQLPIRNQYIVYGVYALALGVGFWFCDVPRKFYGKKRTFPIDGDKKEEEHDVKVMDLSPNMPYSIPREH